MKLETAALLAGALVAAVCLALCGLFFIPVPTANASAVNLVLGTVLGWGGAAMTFYFGSSKSSAAKDATIANLTAPDKQP